jgi:hypothetical protein
MRVAAVYSRTFPVICLRISTVCLSLALVFVRAAGGAFFQSAGRCWLTLPIRGAERALLAFISTVLPISASSV